MYGLMAFLATVTVALAALGVAALVEGLGFVRAALITVATAAVSRYFYRKIEAADR